MLTAIEVRRNDSGSLSIPGAAEPEDWTEVMDAMERTEDRGPLTGWPGWTRVYRTIDGDGLVRWYFVDA